MPSLILLCVALMLAAQAVVVRADDNETLSIIYPKATPTINYIDSIEVIFISTYEYPTVIASCEDFAWVYFFDFSMGDATKAAATFTSIGADYLAANATGVAFPWSCSMAVYYNSATVSIASTSVGGRFVVSSLDGALPVLFDNTMTTVISETSSATSLTQATTTTSDTTSNATSSTTAASSPTSTAVAATGATTGLSSGAKAGIAVGCILGAAVIAGLIATFFFVRRRILANEQRLEELQMQQQQQQRGSSTYGPVNSPQSDSVAMASVYDPKVQLSPQQQQPNVMGIYATVPELPGDTLARYEMGTDQPKPASPYRD